MPITTIELYDCCGCHEYCDYDGKYGGYYYYGWYSDDDYYFSFYYYSYSSY